MRRHKDYQPLIQRMARELLADQTYAPRKYESAGVSIPVGAQTFRLAVARNGWPDRKDGQGKRTNILTVGIDFSLDGGATWQFGYGCTTVGGDMSKKPGVTADMRPDMTTIAGNFPGDPLSTARRVRVSITPGEPLQTRCEIHAYSAVRWPAAKDLNVGELPWL